MTATTIATSRQPDPALLDALAELIPPTLPVGEECDYALPPTEAVVSIGDARLLVTTSDDGGGTHRRAVSNRCGHIVVLPDGADWLAQRLASA